MRAALLLPLALVAGALGAAPAAGAERSWRPDVEAARAYAASRAGVESFAVRTPTRTFGSDPDRRVRSASVIKAMLMAAYLSSPPVRGRPLDAGDRALLAPMIRRSDNATAQRIFDTVGEAGLRRVANAAVMRSFATDPVWGLTQITAADQTRLWLRIERRFPARHRAYAMRLLATIVPAQRWGIGRVRPAGWKLYFKGGWGSGTGAVDHQVALLTRGSDRIAVAILTTDNPSMAYGNETLQGIAARLLRGLEDDAVGRVEPGGAARLP